PASPPPATALVPTSTTTAPAATNEAPTSPARPAATTSTSAVDVTAARSTVREWHTVTVASRASSSCATGLPTTAERPTTTAPRQLSQPRPARQRRLQHDAMNQRVLAQRDQRHPDALHGSVLRIGPRRRSR